VKRMVLLLTVAAALVLALALPASAVDEGADVAHSTCFHSFGPEEGSGPITVVTDRSGGYHVNCNTQTPSLEPTGEGA